MSGWVGGNPGLGKPAWGKINGAGKITRGVSVLRVARGAGTARSRAASPPVGGALSRQSRGPFKTPQPAAYRSRAGARAHWLSRARVAAPASTRGLPQKAHGLIATAQPHSATRPD